MGTLGIQEMIVIFVIALVLFGPKKLPELGRTIGKAITEFRRASNDLKATSPALSPESSWPAARPLAGWDLRMKKSSWVMD
jgi:TatA/E family protein of Tat protein translocase